MKKLILLVSLLITIANAETTKEYPACVSEDAYHMMVHAASKDDHVSLKILIAEGVCFWMRPGMHALVIDPGSVWGNRPMKIRIRSEATWATVYTNSDGVQ